MKTRKNRDLYAGLLFLALFALWTVCVRRVDVRPVGPEGSEVGFAAVNDRFHELTGVNMGLYTVTDWLGLVPLAMCFGFAALGFSQLVRRKSLLRVDADILILGVYYILVISCYLFFEAVPVNYRPVLINGALEASYPSSTTLLTLSVMPTLQFQVRRRCGNGAAGKISSIVTAVFSLFMVCGRTLSGVHWLTDIAGATLLSGGLFALYRFAVAVSDGRSERYGIQRKTG